MSGVIRVLQVLHVMDRGGAEAMVMNLYRRIDRSRVQFDFLVHTDRNGLFDDEIESLGGRIFHIRAFKGYNLLQYYNDCRKFFKSHPEISIVHGHLGSCAAYYLKAAKDASKFTIAHSHSAGTIRNVYDAAYKLFSYPTRFVADQLFGCSTEAGISRYGKSKVKSCIYQNFNNAIDTTLFRFDEVSRRAIRKELNIEDNITVIGHVGRVTPQKNPIKILEIFKAVIRQSPDTRCLWVGTGEMEEEMRLLIKKSGLENRIIMTGVRSDIPEIMSAMDCMVFPSLWEGLPVSVIEAQAANLPVVLSDAISRETEISDLLLWHSIDESDEVWARDAISMAKSYRENRNDYKFDIKASGYDIATTAQWLTKFYEDKSQIR